MSQSIHFEIIKSFSEDYTKDRDYDDILQEIKNILKEEEKKKEKKEEEIDETLKKTFLLENIETSYLTLSANAPEIQELLITNLVILHPQSKYYFVNEQLWQVLQKEIFNQSQEIFNQSQDIKKVVEFYEQVARDFPEIENHYRKKVLVFEAS